VRVRVRVRVCVQDGATSWLNDPAVRKALHVPLESFYGYKFYLDQIEPPFNYTSDGTEAYRLVCIDYLEVYHAAVMENGLCLAALA
jgi:hypothetical protein